MNKDREQHIRERAYHIWLEEGRPEGRDREHWQRAERELQPEQNSEAEAPPTSGPYEPVA
jgi:hypothetical protein